MSAKISHADAILPEPDGSFDPKTLRSALGSFATGVTVITAAGPDDVKVGLTANSFSSVSLNPALVSWSLSLHAASLPVFQDCSHYAIHILGQEQQDIARRFSQSREDKFDAVDWSPGLGNAPLIEGPIARFQCANAHRYYGGDHVIFLGSVEAFDSREGRPLVFCRGQFGEFSGE